MATRPFFVMTLAQRTAGNALNGGGLQLGGRLMDGPSLGNGTNINGMPQCVVALGDPVPLTGCYLVGYQLLSDPDYIQHVPDMIAFMLTIPICELDPEVVFLPPEEI